MNAGVLWLVSVALLSPPDPAAATWQDLKTEYEYLYNAYSSPDSSTFHTVVPRSDDTSPLPVTVSFELYSIGGFDAVSGALDLIGSLNMSWTDISLSLGSVNKPASLATDTVIVDYSKVWTPVIVMVNSVNSVSRVGDSTYKLRFNMKTSQVNWKPRLIAKAACAPDMTYFPFDQQNCELSFTTWFQGSSIITLNVGKNEWNLDNYDINGVWEIEETTSSVSKVNGYDYAKFTIKFNRNAMYFTINLVFPVLLLSLLSGFIFILPAASGERVGFGITCFLSFVVLLQTIMNYMPQTSSPMSLFCYYVIIMMLFTGFLNIVTILLLKVHNDSGSEVPKWLVHFIEIIKCVKLKRWIKARKNARAVSPASDSEKVDLVRRRGTVADNIFRAKWGTDRVTYVHGESGPDQTENIASEPEPVSNGHTKKTAVIKVKEYHSELECDDDSGAGNDSDVTWESVGGILDMFFFLAFLGAQAVFSLFFLVPIGTRV